MEYVETYFRIRSEYQYDRGFSDAQEAEDFHADVRTLFSNAGWEIEKSTSSGCSDTAIRGLERLYLHPMNFSGEILLNSLNEIRTLLLSAKTFHCYGVDCYRTYWEISEAEYLKRLEIQREAIRQDILDTYKTKRSNLYITGNMCDRIAAKYTIHRIADRDKHATLAEPFVSHLFDELVEQGLILVAKTKNGEGFRTATDKDLKKAG